MSQPVLQSVDNALRILELFEGAMTEIGLTEISRSLGLGKSTVYRLLSTLESREFIEQNPDSGRYRLGVRLVHIGASKLGSINIIRECRPILERLSAVTGESALLAFYTNGRVICVDRVSGASAAVQESVIGRTVPAHASAAGKVFLAFMDAHERAGTLRVMDFAARTPATLTSRADLTDALDRVRRAGWAEEQQECDEGLVSYASPVWGYGKKLLAAMFVSGAASRMNARRDILTRELAAAARNASARCGGILPGEGGEPSPAGKGT